jgi:hypothetical protein
MPPVRPTLVPVIALLAAACATVSACSTVIDDSPRDSAELRLIHASTGTGSVDLDVGGKAVVRGLPFGQSSPLEEVPAGQQNLVVRAGGQVIGTLAGVLSAVHVNTLVVSGGTAQLASVVVPDTGAVAPTRANIRFVVVASSNATAPTKLDALLSGAPIGQDSTQRFGGLDSEVSKYWSLLYYDAGQFTVQFVPAGATSPVLASAAFSVAAGQKKALVLSRAANGSYGVEVVVEP